MRPSLHTACALAPTLRLTRSGLGLVRRAREGARMAEEREGFERRVAEERAHRDAENAARLAAFQAERLTLTLESQP